VAELQPGNRREKTKILKQFRAFPVIFIFLFAVFGIIIPLLYWISYSDTII